MSKRSQSGVEPLSEKKILKRRRAAALHNVKASTMILVSRRPGVIGSAWQAFLGSALLLAVLVTILAWDPERWFGANTKTQPLVVYCAAALKLPVETIARQYEEEYGVPIHIQYGASQTLLAGIKMSNLGDLYIPADDSYLHLAAKDRLIEETIPIAEMTPVLAVRKGNPKQIRSLNDLLQKDVRIANANPDTTAVGKVTRDTLRKIGRWDEFEKRVQVSNLTVHDVANDIQVGSSDAGIVWDAVAKQLNGKLDMVELSELAGTKAHVSTSILRCSSQPTAALRFARYLSARDRGLLAFEKDGYRTTEGDRWEKTPEIRLLAGAMLRPAIQETITDFETREGVEVVRVYNGCGILVSQMRTGQKPDAYFACDLSFMKQVNDLFLDSDNISSNQLVILVHKGNPHKIKSLKELAQPGIRIGVGHEKNCALGALTQQTLVQGGFYEAVSKNVQVQHPTGDMLVNVLRSGSLDAVIAYISNAVGCEEELEAIAIDIPCAMAVQPVAIGKESDFKQLTQRLLVAIRSGKSRERFESNGFQWRAK